MDDSEYQVLATAIRAETDPTIVQYVADRSRDDLIAEFFNASAPGPVKCWRNDISHVELTEATINSLAQFDNLTQGKRDAWAYLFNLPIIDFTRNKIRSAPGKVWANAERDAILTDPGTRNARRCELLQWTGSAPPDTVEGGVTAKKCSRYGPVTVDDVSIALNRY
jgi:hypothetical protein